MKAIHVLVLSGAVLGSGALALADDLQGAKTAVRKEAAVLRDPASSVEPGPSAKLRQRADTYAAAVAELPPEEAVTEWSDMMAEALRLSADGTQRSEWPGTSPLAYVLARIPPPELWNGIATAILQQSEGEDAPPQARKLARMLGALLTNRHDEAWAIAAEIESEAPGASPGLLDALAEVSPDDTCKLKAFELALARAEKGDAGIRYLHIPDLVALVGEERASALLARAVALSGTTVQAVDGEQTISLARKVALAEIANVKTPPWALAQDVGATALFEALRAKFPSAGSHDSYEWRQAAGYYVLGLVLNDRADEAIAALPKLVAEASDASGKRSPGSSFTLPSGAVRAIGNQGRGMELHAFLRKLLAKYPMLPFWPTYIDLSVELGHQAEMLRFTSEASEKPNLPPLDQLELRAHRARGLLAADKTDEGVAELLGLARRKYEDPSREILAEQIDIAADLIVVAALLEKEDVLDEAQQIAGNLLLRARLEDAADVASAIRDTDRVALALANAGRTAPAEALLVENLERAIREAAKRDADKRNYGTFRQCQDRLLNLAALYHEAGRHADVLVLLDEAQGWGAGDVSALLFEKSPFSPDPMGVIAARALRQAERNDEARRVINAFLDGEGGNDSAYALLLELGGPDVGSRLDALYARDRFEERPLIWKAQVFIDRKDLPQAQKTVRKAIEIDPSDGEQGKGDRMRAYAVLSDILMLQAETEEAKRMAGAVQAIRLSEKADDFKRAGLNARAIRMYEKALGQFADAYCIQSRLAVRLAESGRMADAEEHYVRAFQLMPSSFGRIESHCFGCEGAFRGGEAQSIAERVFLQLIEESPDNPRLHYLLGYLRSAQNRPDEALESYLRAVELDPDYVNAWAKIQAISRATPLPSAVRDDATVNLLRLDPLGRHTRPEIARMSDLARMWTTLASTRIEVPPTPRNLYPLTASAMSGAEASRSSSHSKTTPLTPGEALVRHSVVGRWLKALKQAARGTL